MQEGVSASSGVRVFSTTLSVGAIALKIAFKAAIYNHLISSVISFFYGTSRFSANWVAYAEVCQSSASFANSFHSTALPPTPNAASTASIQKHASAEPGAESSVDLSIDSAATPNHHFTNIVSRLLKPAKVCPDFKDRADWVACCESRVTQGSFFCCTQQQKADLQWEINKAVWRQFIHDHLSTIIIGALLLLLFLLVVMTFLCKRFAFCPLYRPKSLRTEREISSQNDHHRYSFVTGRYHRPFPAAACNALNPTNGSMPYHPYSFHFQQQTASIIHKAPAIYDAPPPYEYVATIPPPPPPIPTDIRGSAGGSSNNNSQQRIHELDYLLENEVNNIHQSTITENASAS